MLFLLICSAHIAKKSFRAIEVKHYNLAWRQHVHMVHVLKQFGQDWVPERAKSLSCPECPKQFVDDAALFQHRVNKHSVITDGSTGSNNLQSIIPDLSGLNIQEASEGIQKDGKSDVQSSDQQITAHENCGDVIVLDKARAATDYIPCPVCQQAVENNTIAMQMHLDALKPALGLKIKCSCCPMTFIEHRALQQHYKFCRLRAFGESSLQ